MLGTLVSLLVLLAASALVGQALIALSGRSPWSPLAPAVGLAALAAVAWWAVRLPGEGVPAIVAVGVATLAAAIYLRSRTPDASALRAALPVALAATLLGSLPFIVEARFGILGTGLNPDMSQHLFAVDRLAAGASERLISEGYPLGPHALVAALARLGPNTVEAFAGLMLAVAAATCLAPLALLREIGGWRAFAAPLAIGFAYLVSAYYVQGAFKETMLALFAIAFAIALVELADRRGGEEAPAPFAALPLGVLAAGSVYVYSFPGLLWLGGAAVAWGLVELALRVRAGAGAARSVIRHAAPATLGALAVVVAAVAPEAGRMVDFASFETFSPDGAGLGNLFNRLSPFEALGIWPSGDFRVEPGDGTVPAAVFYLGAAAGLGALGFGLGWWWRRGERAAPAAVAAAAALWLYTLLAGTPYQEAKALLLLGALVALVSVRAAAGATPAPIAAAFVAAVGGCAVLVLANGPVGPSAYSPALAELRPELHGRSVLVVAPRKLLDDQHGRDYLVWELRGNRICVVAEGEEDAVRANFDSKLYVTLDDGAVVPEGRFDNRAPIFAGPACPFVPDGARADPSAAAG